LGTIDIRANVVGNLINKIRRRGTEEKVGKEENRPNGKIGNKKKREGEGFFEPNGNS